MKKLIKMLSVVMVIALAFTSVSFANLSKVEAKSAVKSVKVKKAKKNLTLYVGDKKTYKVKVNAKKGKTQFTAKSSDKNVVSVTKKGKKITLKALKAGNAKVTVKSKVDKKKKYVIKVKVVDENQVETTIAPTTTAPAETTTVVPETTKAVEPTSAVPTTAEETTTVESTTVKETTTVEPTTAAEETTPEETTNQEETSEPDEYDMNYTFTVEAGKEISEDIDAYLETMTSVDNLPKTMTCTYVEEKYNSYIHFGGKIDNVGKYEVTVHTKFNYESSMRYTYHVTFVVVDDETLFVDDIEDTDYVYADDEITAEGSYSPRVYGKGDFSYEIVENPGGVFKLNEEESYDYTYTSISYEIKEAGTYKGVVKVWNTDNPDVYTTFTITIEVKSYCKVFGKVTTESGKILEGASVYFEYSEYYFDTATDENGEYSVYLTPDRCAISAWYGDSSSDTKNVNITKDRELNLAINDLYCVTVTSDDMDPEEFGEWEGKYEDENGDEYTVTYGYGSQLFLAEGEYHLYTTGTASIDSQLCSYDAEIIVNVTEDTDVKATLTDLAAIPIQSKALQLGENGIVANTSSYRIYKFVAPSTGKFSFTSDFETYSEDPYATLYDVDFNKISENDDLYFSGDYEDENNNINFYLEGDLDEGKTYYVAVRKWDSFWGGDSARGGLTIEQLD